MFLFQIFDKSLLLIKIEVFADEWIIILQNLNLSQSQDVGALPCHSFCYSFPFEPASFTEPGVSLADSHP